MNTQHGVTEERHQADACTGHQPGPDAKVIGGASMLADGTIELALVLEAPGGGRGHALDVVKPADPRYPAILGKLCGLKPGQEKTVYDDMF